MRPNRRNKQAVSVLNKVEYDGNNPIGMTEDRESPLSANFGTPREPRRGGCYQGDGTAYISIPGLLTTDTFTVWEGSAMPTCTVDGRLDIAAGDKVFGVTVDRTGWFYKMDENSGTTCYDSSGNGNHGTIIDAITVSPEQDTNSIHQYQDVKSWHNDVGYSLDISGTYPVYIPRDENNVLKDVLGNNLQYKGRVPSKAKFVNSPCFLGNGIAYLSIPGLLDTDTVEVYGNSATPTLSVDRMDVANGDKVYGVTIKRNGIVWAEYPLCEIFGVTFYDVSGNGNHATLMNGSSINKGYQDEYHYLQKGCKIIRDTEGEITNIISILSDGSAFTDGSPLTDTNAVLQEGYDFITTNTTQLQMYDYPAIRQVDKNEVWTYNGEMRKVNPSYLKYLSSTNNYSFIKK